MTDRPPAGRRGVVARLLARWLAWLHPTVRESRERARAAHIIGVGAGFSVLAVVAQLLVLQRAAHLAWAALFGLVMVAVFWLLRTRDRPDPAGQLLFGAGTLLVGAAVVAERELHAGTIAWFGVVSATAILSIGLRAGARWLLVSALIVCGTWVARHQGWHGWLEPSPGLLLLRGVALVLAFVLIAGLFEHMRRVAHEELEQLTRSKSQFLANVSHELRTPMNGVLGMTELLLQSSLTGEQREQIELIQRSGRSLVVLLNDLLDMSKVEAGKMELDEVDFELATLLSDLEALHGPLAQARGVRLVVERPADLGVVRGDSMRLRQVLTNLLSNAIKFTPSGVITLAVETDGPHHTFRVTDTGIGISRDALPRLFAPFVQAEAGTTRQYGGTGLGLALSRELVGLMGGVLAAQSEVGVGTTFRFTIALQASVRALVATPPAISDGPTGREHELPPVLVVDDNPINLKVACALVEKSGYRTLSARNGAEAVDIVTRESVLAVLMDCDMPVMDGFVATEHIRGLDSEVALVPVVALTASAMPEELARCRQAGMNDCLIKPVSLEQIRNTLRQVVVLQETMQR